MMPGSALARAGVVQTAHLLLVDLILVRRTGWHRRRVMSRRVALALLMDWFHGRSLVSTYAEA